MVDCGECVKLVTDVEVRQAPSEVEGGSPSKVMVCAPSEEIMGVFQYPGEGAVDVYAVFGRHVAGSVQLVSKS